MVSSTTHHIHGLETAAFFPTAPACSGGCNKDNKTHFCLVLFKMQEINQESLCRYFANNGLFGESRFQLHGVHLFFLGEELGGESK